MKHIFMIGCYFKNDIYSHSCFSLLQSLKNSRNIITLVTSNCSCFSSSQTFSCSQEELVDDDCDPVLIPYAPLEPTKKYGRFKYYITKYLKLNLFLETLRGIAFSWKTRKADIIHFDQVLKSFGVLSFLVLLTLANLRKQKVIVTIHELDPLQTKYRKLNQLYKRACKVIVLSRSMKDDLINLGIDDDRIEVIHQGVFLGVVGEYPREGFIYWGGHKLLNNKGFETLLAAVAIIKEKGYQTKTTIYTGHGCVGLEEGKSMVTERNLDQFIEWSEFLSGRELSEAYQRCIACIVPFTGGSGRHPATHAMANKTPVIATEKAELPEYLGDDGIYIQPNSPEDLLNAMTQLMRNPARVEEYGKRLRKRAEEKFEWNIIAQRITTIYDTV